MSSSHASQTRDEQTLESKAVTYALSSDLELDMRERRKQFLIKVEIKTFIGRKLFLGSEENPRNREKESSRHKYARKSVAVRLKANLVWLPEISY